MNVKILKDEASFKTFRITLEGSEGDLYFTRAAQELSKENPVKGFRPGTVPFEILEKSLDKNLVTKSVAREAIKAVLPDFFKTQRLYFIGEPLIQFTQIQKGKPLEFEIGLALWPAIKLSDHKNIEVKGRKPEVSEEEISRALNHIKKSRKAEKLDDTFARSLGNFKNLGELKASVKEGLLYEKNQLFLRKKRDELLEAVRESSAIELAPFLIDQEARKIVEHEVREIERQGMSVEEYLKQIGRTENDFLKQAQEIARKRLENAFILYDIAKKEDIKVTDEEIDQRLSAILARFSNPDEAAKEINPQAIKNQLRQQMLEEKVFSQILDKQIITT